MLRTTNLRVPHLSRPAVDPSLLFAKGGIHKCPYNELLFSLHLQRAQRIHGRPGQVGHPEVRGAYGRSWGKAFSKLTASCTLMSAATGLKFDRTAR
jgi:hypothetical protein